MRSDQSPMQLSITDRRDLVRIHDAINKLSEELASLSDNPDHKIYSNEEFCNLMKISKKTAQRWRDAGLIRYRSIGNKIYYTLSDVLQMLEDNSHQNI